MLSLVQELEAFASSDALTDLLKVRGETRNLAAASRGWQALRTLLEISDVRRSTFDLLSLCSLSYFKITVCYLRINKRRVFGVHLHTFDRTTP